MKMKSVKMSLVVAAGAITLALAPKTAMAQIGPNSLTWSVNSTTVTNGSSGNASVTNPAGSNFYFYMQLRGVSGNGGSTSYYCSVTNAATGAAVYTPFSGSTANDAQYTNGPMTLARGTYNSYCSATWSGNHVNGTVTTPFIQITQQ